MTAVQLSLPHPQPDPHRWQRKTCSPVTNFATS